MIMWLVVEGKVVEERVVEVCIKGSWSAVNQNVLLATTIHSKSI
jgi:hypothetical protein